MKNLADFIIEALINRPELEKDLKFEEVSKKEYIDILLSDEFNYKGGLLGDELITKNKIDEDFNLLNDCDLFKITYKDKILGIVSYVYLNNKIDDTFYKFFESTMKKIYNYFEKRYTGVEKGNDLADKINIIKYLNLDGNAYSKIKSILNDTVYIESLQISKEAKKKYDVNHIALIKIVFDKLKEIFKKDGKDFILAHGKDKRVSDLYCKLGGFVNFKNFKIPDETGGSFERWIWEANEHCVIYKINPIKFTDEDKKKLKDGHKSYKNSKK